jgi:hypothetical protein
MSSSFVLQQPSLKNPVKGSKEHGTNGCPKTLKEDSAGISALYIEGRIENKIALRTRVELE